MANEISRPVLLSGGNPQIPLGYGDGPVQDYIAAMPGWKQGLGRRLDDLVTAALPEVEKAVKWNSPFYGVRQGLWFLSFHCLTRYVKVAFFRGADLQPVPPVGSKQPLVRYLHIPEDGVFDQFQFTDWVRQASRLPGEPL
ncbi:DUF1801 domain-containing protein [uncultured Paracoccus sp.]|uniref:DUF1801 domain-containing protein n=1 Tax=uncultured Paracoccus sp. TaxID=189685 RepID=UPI0025FE457E|nr:DUF1801 domain-containing protein [uncultured Paracoccus sp.]